MLRLIKSKIALSIFFIGFSDISSLKSIVTFNNNNSTIYCSSDPFKTNKYNRAFDYLKDLQHKVKCIHKKLSFDKNRISDDVYCVEGPITTDAISKMINTAPDEVKRLVIDEINEYEEDNERRISDFNYFYHLNKDNRIYKSISNIISKSVQPIEMRIINNIYDYYCDNDSNTADHSLSEEEFDEYFHDVCLSELLRIVLYTAIFSKDISINPDTKPRYSKSACEIIYEEMKKDAYVEKSKNSMLSSIKGEYMQAKNDAIDAIEKLFGMKDLFSQQVRNISKSQLKNINISVNNKNKQLSFYENKKAAIIESITKIINDTIERMLPESLKRQSIENKKAYLKAEIEYRFTNENDVSEYQKAIQYEIGLSVTIQALHTEIKNTILNKYPALK